MSNDKTTLADAQPGGRVRLGDGWTGWATQYPNKMPKLCGARELAELNHYPEEGQRLLFLAENPVHVGDLVDAARAALPFVAFAYSKGVAGAEEAGRAIETALSIQPSPGDLEALVQEALEYFERAGDAGDRKYVAAIRGALAARQPVGQIDEAAVLRRAAAVLYTWEDDPNLTGYMGDFKDACGILELLAQHAAPPTQAVDMTAAQAVAVYDAVTRRNFTRDVKTDEDKARTVTAALTDSQAVGEPVDYIEFLDRQNDSLRRAIHAIMAKLAILLDEDQFADVDAIALAAGVNPPAQAVVPEGYVLSLIPKEDTPAFNAACTAAHEESKAGTGPCGVFIAGHRHMRVNAPAVSAQAVDLGALQGVAAEYQKWIEFHSAGNGDYDDFLRMHVFTDSQAVGK